MEKLKFKVGDVIIYTEYLSLRKVISMTRNGITVRCLDTNSSDSIGNEYNVSIETAARIYSFSEETVVDKILEKYTNE